jgi:hypothetical protein
MHWKDMKRNEGTWKEGGEEEGRWKEERKGGKGREIRILWRGREENG